MTSRPPLTIEQIFTFRDQETEGRGLFGPYDDEGEDLQEDWQEDWDHWQDWHHWHEDWQEDWQEEDLEDRDAHLVAVVPKPKKVRPVIRKVSGEEWFLNNVVEKGLVGEKNVPHDVWRRVIVPLAISMKSKKMCCLRLSDKKLRSRIIRMVEARDLRFNLSRGCFRFPTSDCINYGRLMVSVLNPITFSKDFTSIDKLLMNGDLKIGSLEFMWTIVNEDDFEGPVDPYYTHRLKPSYTYDERGEDNSWLAVIEEIESYSNIKIKERAIEQGMSLRQLLHILMKTWREISIR